MKQTRVHSALVGFPAAANAVPSFQEFVVSPEEQRLVLPRPGQVAQNYASLEKDGLGAGQVEDSGLIYVCIHIHICISIYIYVKIFAKKIYIHMYMDVCTYACMQACMYVYTSV